MLSLILMTALGAVGDVPASAPQNAAKAPSKTSAATTKVSYPASRVSSFYGLADEFSCTGCGYGGYCCPTDDVDLFLPCAPAGPCAPWAPNPVRPVCGFRVNTHPCPTPCTVCPPRPPYRQAPCP